MIKTKREQARTTDEEKCGEKRMKEDWANKVGELTGFIG